MQTINVRLPDGTIEPRNFPDEMSKEEIGSILKMKYGVKKEEPKMGWEGVGEDIKSSISGLPSALGHFLSSLPEQAAQSAKQIVTNPLRATENVGAGLLEGLKGAVNIPSNIAEYLKSKQIGETGLGRSARDLLEQQYRIGDTGLQQKILGEPQEGDVLLQGLGSYAPYAGIGGVAKGLPGVLKRAGGAATYAVGQNQDPLQTALMAMAGEGIARTPELVSRGVGKSLSPLSRLSANELSEAQRVSSGTETNLGRVLENPYLSKTFENVVSEAPFSGGYESMQRTADVLKDRGENFLKEFKGTQEVSDVGGKLQKALVAAEKETRATKNELFGKLNAESDKLGVKTNRENFRTIARQKLDEIAADPDLAAHTDPAVKKLLNDTASGKKSAEYSLKNTDLLRGKLGEKASDAFTSGNSELGSIYGELKKAVDEDINTAIDRSGNKNLTKLRDDAMDFYRKEWVPFEEPEIVKFTRKGGDPDTLVSSFMKNTRLGERGRLLEKLTEKLKPEERDSLSYAYFSNALTKEGVNPLQFRNLFENLGEKRSRALLGDKMTKELQDYSKIVSMNVKPLTLMFNPETGAKLSQIPGWSTLGGLVGSGHLKSALGLVGGGNIARRALTNESVRNALIQKLIESRTRQTGKTNLSPFVQSLSASINKNEQVDK